MPQEAKKEDRQQPKPKGAKVPNAASEPGVPHAQNPADKKAQQQTATNGSGGQATPKSPAGASTPPETQTPPPGLDQSKHARSQELARQAEVLREGIFPSLMAEAMKLDKFVETAAYHVYLESLLRDLGNPIDPLERMLVEQMSFAHFRVAQLQVNAANSKGIEAVKIQNAVTVRLLGELRRMMLTFKAYRSTPKLSNQKPQANLKAYKVAQ